MPSLPKEHSLSGAKDPKDFYVCITEDPADVVAWRSGPTAKDYRIPRSSWCSLTCLRMLLLLEERHAPSLDELFTAACEASVFRWDDTLPGWKGAFLPELALYIGSYGFETRFERGMDAEAIAQAIASGYCVFPRVSPDIRFPDNDEEPAKRSGHFVFMYAYDRAEDGSLAFRLNNASGYAPLGSQIGVRIKEKRFTQLFSGDAILVRPL